MRVENFMKNKNLKTKDQKRVQITDRKEIDKMYYNQLLSF
jgi:hypothetical protein